MLTTARITTMLLLVFEVTLSFSQSPSKISTDTTQFTIHHGESMVYYVDNSYNRNQFLIPFIESELKGMKDSLQRTLFGSVKGVNYFKGAKDALKNYLAFMGMFESNPNFLDNVDKYKQDTLIFDSIKQAHFFLKININAFNNLLEYQFVLVKIAVGSGRKDNFFKLDQYRTTSIFIDPNGADYKIKIRNSLHQVITEANEPPIPIVHYNNHVVSVYDTIFTTPGTFTLQADATDTDSPPEQITYNWETAGSNYKGKELTVFVNGNATFPIILRVSDGINRVVRSIWVVTHYAPWVNIQPNYTAPLFLNSKLSLYSFHKVFKNYDFSSLLNRTFTSVKNYGSILGHDDTGWTEVMPKLTVFSDVTNNSDISFYQIKFNKIGDSVVNYKENYVPDNSFDNGRFLGSAQFSVNRIKTTPSGNYNGDALSHAYFYRIFMNTNSDEVVTVPSVKYFKISVKRNGLQSASNFNVQFVKISRFSPYLYSSFIQYTVFTNFFNFTQVGIGLEYLIAPCLSVEGVVGSSTSTSFSSPVTPFYKIGGNVDLYDYQNIFKLRFSTVALSKQAYYYGLDLKKDKTIDIGYAGNQLKVGFGGSYETGFTSSEYWPISLGLFYNYFPTGFKLNGNGEFGFKLKFSFSATR